MLIQILAFLLGLAGLSLGAKWLVAGAARLAYSLGISVLAVGLTIVSFGTSAPELVVSVMASAAGRMDVAVGNAIGSNIANIALILGLTGVLSPIPLGRSLVRRDIPVMVVVSLALFALGWNGVLSRAEGALLVTGLVAYTVWTLRAASVEREAVPSSRRAGLLLSSATDREQVGRFRDGTLVLGGLAALAISARLLVMSSIFFARILGISELVIGLTVVAIGTSLPELATSLAAATRRQGDIAGGNIVGSNIFNLLGILGLAAMVRPLRIAPSMLALHLPVMVALSAALFPLALIRHRLGRREGIVLLACYGVFLALTFTRITA